MTVLNTTACDSLFSVALKEHYFPQAQDGHRLNVSAWQCEAARVVSYENRQGGTDSRGVL